MNQVMIYKIVEADSPAVLETRVNNNILDGWVPTGGVAAVNTRIGGAVLLQSMTKVVEAEVLAEPVEE